MLWWPLLTHFTSRTWKPILEEFTDPAIGFPDNCLSCRFLQPLSTESVSLFFFNEALYHLTYCSLYRIHFKSKHNLWSHLSLMNGNKSFSWGFPCCINNLCVFPFSFLPKSYLHSKQHLIFLSIYCYVYTYMYMP